jgi:hypothetical protein
MSDQPIPIGTARGRKASGAIAADVPEHDPGRNLYQRISAITQAIGPVEATSKTASTAGGKKAIGIDDVEEVLGPLLAEHGVVTEWSSAAAPERISLPARDGTFDVWMVRLKVRLVNADTPEDRTDWAEWADIGSNPIAGSSFARKAFYKALFHLAAAEDEGKPAARDQGSAPRSTQGGPAGSGEGQRPRKVLIEPGCPDCGGSLAIIYADGKRPFIGHAEWKRGEDSCGWRPAFDVQAQWIRDAEAGAAAAEMMSQPMTDEGPPPEDGPVTIIELIQTAARKTLEFSKMDAEACKAVMTHHGWDGKAKSTDWLRSFEETGPLVSLISDLTGCIRGVRDNPAPIPF